MSKRKSLLYCITNAAADNMKTGLGERVDFNMNTGSSAYGVSGTRVCGEILYSRKFEHGTIIIVSNELREKTKEAAFSWLFVPLWVSECSQSGIMHWANTGASVSGAGPDPDLAIVKQEFIPPVPPPKPFVLHISTFEGMWDRVQKVGKAAGEAITFADQGEADYFLARLSEAIAVTNFSHPDDRAKAEKLISLLSVTQER